jgi:hypothetical protein
MYTLTEDPNTILHVRDRDPGQEKEQAYIPADPLNGDYLAYLDWLAEGNTPNPYVPPPIATTLPETPPLEDRVADLETRVDTLEASDG